MEITVDVAYKSLNKYSEILCGDKVEILQTEDSNIMILADGMGSGVKANILSTLTSKILGTMFLNGATLEECVDTISETLPICQVRQVAYSTFSILQQDWYTTVSHPMAKKYRHGVRVLHNTCTPDG